jgi:hypothetical protein
LASIDTVRPPLPPRTRAISLGAAVLAHILLGLGFVLAIQIPRLVAPPPVQVSLVPPIPEIAPARPRRAAPPPRAVEKAPPPAPRYAPSIGPAQIPPLPIPAAPPDKATRDRLFSAPFKPHDAREALRAATGCQDPDKLSPDERDACRKINHDRGANAPTYAVGPSDPKKKAFLDKQAAKNEAHRKAMEAPGEHPMQACDGPMSNLGFSCNSGSTAHINF